MPEEMTPEQMKQWMRQWRNAEVELQRQKMRELQAMTDEEALRRFDAAMAAAEGVPIDPSRWNYSGRVEQQRWFMKLRRSSAP